MLDWTAAILAGLARGLLYGLLIYKVWRVIS
jgi:hypothetical protein